MILEAGSPNQGAGKVPGEVFLILQTAALLLCLFSLSLCSLVSLPDLIDTSPVWIRASPFWPHLILIISLMILSPNTVRRQIQ